MISFTHFFPLQSAFAMAVDKPKGQTTERVVVALSKCNLGITDCQYACLYVAMICVKMGQHLRILLTEKENKDLEWQSLLYINNLCCDPSIEAFFAGYSKIQQN